MVIQFSVTTEQMSLWAKIFQFFSLLYENMYLFVYITV